MLGRFAATLGFETFVELPHQRSVTSPLLLGPSLLVRHVSGLNKRRLHVRGHVHRARQRELQTVPVPKGTGLVR